jgi:predicted ATPase/DNA-binding SARP family transcriptional activator
VEQSLSVLGPLAVVTERGPAKLRPAQRRLLSILLLEPDGQLERDVLLDRMWGEATPATATASLHVHVSGLRRSVPRLIETTASGYRVDMDGRRYDRAEFDELAERAGRHAREGDWPAVLDTASQALERWRGAPFDELRNDEFAAPEINRLTERWLDLLELHVRALLAGGRADQAIERLNELVLRHPLREPLWELLMLALYRSGRQAEALRTFQEARRVLAEELDVEPGQALRHLEERILLSDPELGEPERAPRADNLPSTPTSFVGREDDLRQLTGLLSRERLVTIVGGPGLGKTRLAIETGHALVDRHPGGVWFVSLADARNRLEVIGAILSATAVPDHASSLDDLAKRLAHRPAVLILDNCEHQREICGEFCELVLSAGGELRLLATSRQALGVDGERVWLIDPLPPPEPPDDAAGVPAPASASPAVRMFLDRARAVDRTFRLAPEVVPSVAELCRRAGGIPLVLELAARWVHALGLDDIAEMLSSEPPGAEAGEPGHHRSLTAAIEWSMALLPPEDRRLFVASAIFNGRFALDDVRAVCAPDHEPRRLARAVARLAEASLIVVERQPDGAALYRMLVPIRELAREQLLASADWEAASDRFVAHYLQKDYRRSEDPFRAVVDLRGVDTDLDNLRDAFALGLSRGQADDVARALAPLGGYFMNRYLAWEGRSWVTRALEQVSDPLARAYALRSLGSYAQLTDDLDESLQIFGEALIAFEQVGDETGTSRCLLSLAALRVRRGEWPAAIQTAAQARQLISGSENISGLGLAAYYLGESLAYSGNTVQGVTELRAAATLWRRAGELGTASTALSTLTKVAVLTGREQLAQRTAPQALALARRSESPFRQVRSLAASAMLEARWGDPDRGRGMLLEGHVLIGQSEHDLVFEFLFPAAMLLHRLGRWSLMSDVVHAAENLLSELGYGYPQPWQEAVATWKRDAQARTGAPGSRDARRDASRTVEETVYEVLGVLREEPVHSKHAQGAGRAT